MKYLISILMLFVLSRCSTEIQAYTDYDPDYDQWTFQTFGWSEKTNPEANPLHYNDLNDKRIKNAVLKQLQKRKYRLTSDKPHLILQYHIIVEDKSAVITEPFGYAYGPYWMRRNQEVYTYTQGTLILDLIDTRINQLVWRGWATSVIDDVTSPEQIDQLVESAVRKMFVKFPNAKN